MLDWVQTTEDRFSRVRTHVAFHGPSFDLTYSVSVRNIAFFALCFYGDICDEQNDTHWKRQVMVGVVLSVKHVHVMYNPLHPTFI